MKIWPLQFQQKLISIVSITLTVTGFCVVLGEIIKSYIEDGSNGSSLVVIGIDCLIFGAILFIEILCLVGAFKNNKFLLIPFILCLCVSILASISLVIFIVYNGCTETNQSVDNSGSKIFWALALLPLFLLVFSIYSLLITVQFYKQISSGITFGTTQGDELHLTQNTDGTQNTNTMHKLYSFEEEYSAV